MAERVLCEAALRVSVDGGGDRTLLAVRDGAMVRFWADTRALEGTLQGDPVQLSALGGYCRVEFADDRVHLEFKADDSARKRCDFPAADLADALAWVRSLGHPSEDPGP